VKHVNEALSEARAEVVQLTAEVAEKEAILSSVKEEMLAEQEQLMQKVLFKCCLDWGTYILVDGNCLFGPSTNVSSLTSQC
jgi:hypothetical protein